MLSERSNKQKYNSTCSIPCSERGKETMPHHLLSPNNPTITQCAATGNPLRLNSNQMRSLSVNRLKRRTIHIINTPLVEEGISTSCKCCGQYQCFPLPHNINQGSQLISWLRFICFVFTETFDSHDNQKAQQLATLRQIKSIPCSSNVWIQAKLYRFRERRHERMMSMDWSLFQHFRFHLDAQLS